MSSYLVLARKYRPKQFSDIVGQQAVVKTLVNAIKLKRTHQAYVFSGSRGIGKTSIARIFSKALRCQNVVEKEDGLLYSCDQCADCIEIAAGNSVSVLEIDGASNNGVESVREIRENVKFLPTTGTYKVYIIDEVHMLSTAAFNALLKTLEEPPEHVVFIFATTESHKIPDTILGRCQRFDFKRMTVAQITQGLKEILKAEKIEAEDAAINLIARSAEGSMRDALSIADQVISFSGMKVSARAVRDSVGLIGTEMVLAILKTVLERDAKAGVGHVQTAFNQGVDLKVLLKALTEMMHALILMQVGIDHPETHFNDDELKQISGLMSLREIEENEMIFQVFHHGLDLLSRAAQPKLVFDMLVVKTALAEALIEVGAPSDEAPRRSVRQSPVEVKAAPAPTPVSVAEPVAEPVVTPLVTPAVAPAPVPAPMLVKVEKLPKGWEGFIEYCFESKPVVGVIMESVVEWILPLPEQNTCRLGFREGDQAKATQLSQKLIREQILKALEEYFGFKCQLDIFFSSEKGESMAERSVREKGEAREERLKNIHSHAVIVEAKSLFGADLSHIELMEND